LGFFPRTLKFYIGVLLIMPRGFPCGISVYNFLRIV